MPRKIVIYGGTFDPFHSAHKEIVDYLSSHFDTVILVPTNVTYYRDNNTMFSFEKRCEMIRKEIGLLSNVIISPIEKSIPPNWRFIDTLKMLTESLALCDQSSVDKIVKQLKSSNIQFYVAIGSDSLQKFKTWYDWEDIIKIAKLIVFNRPGYEDNFPDGIEYEYVSMNNPESSTRIRQEILAKS